MSISSLKQKLQKMKKIYICQCICIVMRQMKKSKLQYYLKWNFKKFLNFWMPTCIIYSKKIKLLCKKSWIIVQLFLIDTRFQLRQILKLQFIFFYFFFLTELLFKISNFSSMRFKNFEVVKTRGNRSKFSNWSR